MYSCPVPVKCFAGKLEVSGDVFMLDYKRLHMVERPLLWTRRLLN